MAAQGACGLRRYCTEGVPLVSKVSVIFSSIALWLLLGPPAISAQDLSVRLATPQGNSRVVADFVGVTRWVLVNVWGARCPPCIEEMPELSSLHEDNQARGVTVLGIAIDFPSFGMAKRGEVQQFLDDYLIEFPVLLADQHKVSRVTGMRLRAVPSSFLYKPDGTLSKVWIGAVTQTQIEAYLAGADDRFRKP